MELYRHQVYLTASKTLSLKEMECPCGCGVAFAHADLLNAWEKLRAEYGKPIKVVSGIRCPEYNNNPPINSNSRSGHVWGQALDIGRSTIDFQDEDIYRLLVRCGFTGIGRGETQQHIDVKPRTHFWEYKDGKMPEDERGRELYNEVKNNA